MDSKAFTKDMFFVRVSVSARRHLHQGDHISDCLLATKVADPLAFDEAVFQEVTEEALGDDHAQDLLCGGNQRD